MGVALLAGVYLFLPLLYETLTARSLRQQYSTSETPEVDLYRETTSLFSQSYSGGRVVLPGPDFGGVRPETVTVDLAPFEVDLLRSVGAGRISTEDPISGTLRAEVSEGEIRRIVRQEAYGSFPVLGVEIEEDAVTVQSEATVLGQALPVSVEGGVSVRNGALVFEPTRVEASGLEVAPGLARRLLRGASFSYPIEGLPPGASVTEAEAEEDRLVLTGEMGDLAPG